MRLEKVSNTGYVELVFGPRWTYIATVRNFLQHFLVVTISNHKCADIVSMAASELLENAIKYASEEGTKISVHYLEEKNILILSVENFTSKENIKILEEQIKEVNTGTPEEMYLKKMLQAAERSDGGSQLGFARIRYESGSDIEYEIENDLVKISVSFNLSKIGGK